MRQGAGCGNLLPQSRKEGFRVVAGLSYEDARRLVDVFNTESCWLVSIDGVENEETRWQILEQVLAAKRDRNNRLPIALAARHHLCHTVDA